MIKIKNLTFSHDKEIILDDLSFEIKPQERIILLGTNGSGKSTLLKIINGLIFPQTGQYCYNNQLITKKLCRQRNFQRDFRKNMAFLFQNPDTMLFSPTVFDEIAFGARQLGLNDIDQKVHYWAKLFGIEKHLSKIPFTLSGGEKQKVCLAALLIFEPQILLLDEPTSSLDPRTIGWLKDFLQNLKITTIISTQSLSLSSELGDRALVLSEQHRLIYDGEINNFLNNQDKLLEANLIHIHQHQHGNLQHQHYHTHDWE